MSGPYDLPTLTEEELKELRENHAEHVRVWVEAYLKYIKTERGFTFTIPEKEGEGDREV